jgi:hypothetical protein
MGSKLSFLVELLDRFSDPGLKIERQLAAVKTELKGLDLAARQTKLEKVTDPLKRQKLELQIQRDKLNAARDALGKHGRAAAEAAGKTDGFRGKLRDLAIIGDVVGRGISFATSKAVDFGRRVGEAIKFRQGNVLALETMFKAPGEASAVFEKLLALEGKLGRPAGEVVKMGVALAELKVPKEDLAGIVTVLEDLRAATNSTAKMEQVFGVLQGLLSKPIIHGNFVEGLAGSGIELDTVYTKIAKLAGLASKGDLSKLFEGQGGALDSKLGVVAVLQAIVDKVGDIGSKSAQSASTLEGQVNKLETRFLQMWNVVAKSEGFKTFSRAFDNVLAVLDPNGKRGRKTKAALSRSPTRSARSSQSLRRRGRAAEDRRVLQGDHEGAKSTLGILGKSAGFIDKIRQGHCQGGHDLGAARQRAQRGRRRPFEKLEAVHRSAVAPDFARPRGSSTNGVRDQPTRNGSRPLVATPLRFEVNVDARGATKDDAEVIGRKVGEAVKAQLPGALNTLLEQHATELGETP